MIVQVPEWPEQWNGWRFTASGQQLVSPDGDRITPERLRGLLWRHAMERRAAARRAREQQFAVVARGFKRTVTMERQDPRR